jgi:type IV pilus assembly protein PilQ
MKVLYTISLVILVVFVAVDASSGQQQSSQKNPFAPLEAAIAKLSEDTPRSAGTRMKIDSDEPIVTEVFKLNFASARNIESTVNGLVSTGGRVGVDDRLNYIVVSDTSSNLKRIEAAIKQLDVKAPQVMIEALIINVKLTDQLKMGVDWTKLGTSSNFLSGGFNITSSTNPYGKVTFSTTPGNWNIQGLIDFVETNKDVRILANPKVLVLNNSTAIIKTIKEIPYQELSETSSGGNIGTTAFKEAGVTLEVTPRVSEDGYIIMEIRPEQSAQVDTFTVENSEVPVIEKRNADTTLRVKDGQTIIIGGLREKQPSVQESKVPLLGDIPIIGALFRKIDTEQIESELGVFITPHLYTDGQLSADDMELLHSTDDYGDIYETSDLLRLQTDSE